MPQLHLYVPDETAAQVTARAKARGISVSKLLAEMVRREIGKGWPDGFFKEVVGGWLGEPLERPEQLALEERDRL
jgi:hypothetical protein